MSKFKFRRKLAPIMALIRLRHGSAMTNSNFNHFSPDVLIIVLLAASSSSSAGLACLSTKQRGIADNPAPVSIKNVKLDSLHLMESLRWMAMSWFIAYLDGNDSSLLKTYSGSFRGSYAWSYPINMNSIGICVDSQILFVSYGWITWLCITFCEYFLCHFDRNSGVYVDRNR